MIEQSTKQRIRLQEIWVSSYQEKIVLLFLEQLILALLISPDTNQLLEQANGWIAVVIQYIIRVGMIIANFVI